MAPRGNKGNKKADAANNPEYQDKRKRNNEVRRKFQGSIIN